MAVLINGMEMSMHCMDCPFMVIRDNYDCILQSAESSESFESLEQMEVGCPLVPVPDHGDLIDRDALLDTATIHWSQTTNESCFPIDEIEYAPTIIPASKEGE